MNDFEPRWHVEALDELIAPNANKFVGFYECT